MLPIFSYLGEKFINLQLLTIYQSIVIMSYKVVLFSVINIPLKVDENYDKYYHHNSEASFGNGKGTDIKKVAAS